MKFNSVFLRHDFTGSTANPKLFSFVCISYLPYTFALFNAILITGLPIADSLIPILSLLSSSAEIAENQLLQMSFASPLPVIR